MKPTLVILAAGLGRRFGSHKQLEPVGPGNAALLDYTLYDAIRAGFSRVVCIIRPELEQACRAQLDPRWRSQLDITYAHQTVHNLPAPCHPPADRQRPWGTAHAVLMAQGSVNEPFAVANADDFYGATAFEALFRHLTQTPAEHPPTYALISFVLRDTLPPAGRVNRATCQCSPDGWLEQIHEITGVERQHGNGRRQDASGHAETLPGETPVSMNLWGFLPSFFAQLEGGMRRFLAIHQASTDQEFYLPTAVQELIQKGAARVRVLPAGGPWCGLTHENDRCHVMQFLRERVDRGEYPERPWA
jgi:dTDP-glucose pyrophosphorylase